VTRLTDPDSALSRLRDWLAQKLMTAPDPGEAWCMRCALNDGRTLVVTADGWRDHVRLHQDEPGTQEVSVKASWPPEQDQERED
jgi:hypothetical protein